MMNHVEKALAAFAASMALMCLLLTGCSSGSAAPSTQAPVTEPAPTLQSLMGSDYGQQISDTITMQMGNRMDKNPDIDYYPISENTPLSSYVQIGPDTAFEVDEEGCVIIQLPAGSVTDAAQGIQEFRIGVYA